ncbi:MAG: DEAD/DEAH box helicase [Deltaproteobacteria bacterium]|nr:DEAD/DEAH box helicase [Deltaproteobacteria bacterium]
MYIRAIEGLHERLVANIEASDHLADPGLLAQRRRRLQEAGALRQPAFVESTRNYATGKPFASVLDRLPAAGGEVRALFERLAGRAPDDAKLLYDPPRSHQLESLDELLVRGRNIVVFTGTGSGKTECFTLPILARTYAEAVAHPASFGTYAMRALIMYPMNALVNDQLSRIRRLLGDPEVADAFRSQSAGRPVRFAQYTGRTPFPGLRDFGARDRRRMDAFGRFYLDTVLKPAELDAPPVEGARMLRDMLRARGRWPVKRSLRDWYGGKKYGSSNHLWADRLHPDPLDSELIARHEVYGYAHPATGAALGGPPDVLITNYSMLEYMLLRPVERPIFDRTRAWLEDHPEQTFLLVLDEAHLYRGAQGTEVALLVRRLFERLGLWDPQRVRQIRVAITSASFSAGERAREFAAQLTGLPVASFTPVSGEIESRNVGAAGDARLAATLAAVTPAALYAASDTPARLQLVEPLLDALGRRGDAPTADAPDAFEHALHAALEDLPVRRALVHHTQQEALQLPELAERLFPNAEGQLAATESLIALCTLARNPLGGGNLLPSRIHSFHRGLPGLWVCLDPACSGVAPEHRGVVAGCMYAQPRERCDACGARVLELLSCRACGAAYVQGYLREDAAARFLWQSGEQSSGATSGLAKVHVLLEALTSPPDFAEAQLLDARTGFLLSGTESTGRETREVWLYRLGLRKDEPTDAGRPFYRCGVCGEDNDRRVPNRPPVFRSPVENHRTEGQEPFYSLVHEQLLSQPPRTRSAGPLERDTPLKGRKVLVFSDGRQKAARLAAELGRAALRDSARPMLLRGFLELRAMGFPRGLDSAYLALLLGARSLGVELRTTDETIDADVRRHAEMAEQVVEAGFLPNLEMEFAAQRPPAPVATTLLRIVRDKLAGLQALALARIVPHPHPGMEALFQKQVLAKVALGRLDEAGKRALVNLWLGLVLERHGCSLYAPSQLEEGSWFLAGQASSGSMRSFAALLTAAEGKAGAKVFGEKWLPVLRAFFFPGGAKEEGVLSAQRISLDISAPLGTLAGWQRCRRCSRVQIEGALAPVCVHCAAADTLEPLDRGNAVDQFLARKGFYRTPVVEALAGRGTTVQPVVVREHSAQLSQPGGEAHSWTERHELAFQDITTPDVEGMRSVVDVLSCTTTMEVGIDIGSLLGVAMRNMPPGRANYQQRAGRAGRRGSGVATVVTYADQDGHNQHHYENPQKLIKDPVPDPRLNLSNGWIARRHANAFVLQRYLAARVGALPKDAPAPHHAHLFASLGLVQEFVDGGPEIGLRDLEVWLAAPDVRDELRAALERWLPPEVDGREAILDSFAQHLTACVRRALDRELQAAAGEVPAGAAPPAPLVEEGAEEASEGPDETAAPEGDGELTEVEAEAASEADDASADDEDVAAEDGAGPRRDEYLLERLLYEGVLPKYAFPTDLVGFHVFEATNGLNKAPKVARDKLRFVPQRDRALALSEYAPGKTVFIGGREWFCGGLYDPYRPLAKALEQMRHVRICARCEHAKLFDAPEQGMGEACPLCGDWEFGQESHPWLVPPGFAHPVSFPPRTDIEEQETARAGRAVLATVSPEAAAWAEVDGAACVQRFLGHASDFELLVTNEGPRRAGYRLCPVRPDQPISTGQKGGPWRETSAAFTAPRSRGGTVAGAALGSPLIVMTTRPRSRGAAVARTSNGSRSASTPGAAAASSAM